jgi:hypothetical protein
MVVFSIEKLQSRFNFIIAKKAILFLLFVSSSAFGFNDFQTDNPKLIINLDHSQAEKLDAGALEKTNHAKELILGYAKDWQQRFGRLRRNLKINLIPTERQIDVSGNRAEGVWSWKSFENEEGTSVLGISGDLYVNLNSTSLSQEALVAHESSHAFLVTYNPKILESWKDLVMYNEGLAELFSVNYEPSPWKGWSKVVAAHRDNTAIKASDISAYGYRILNMLNHHPTTPHDIGFFYMYVVRNGKVDLDQDLKECNDSFIKEECQKWLLKNPDEFDLRMTHE